ncbi:MAG: UDP-N-acetylmuramate--L-alanine ligase [Anaerolineales bacterium]|jgi:UDP-N-acetylmuramate--alanine ligase
MSRRVHLVGIGGAGMSAIARVLLGRGEQITGSDRAHSPYTDALEKMGVQITYGHQARNVSGADLVVASSAVPDDNVELQAAREQGIPVSRRADFLGELTQGFRTVAVAGTHGKTTTTGMIAWILEQDGRRPTFIVGGMLPDLGGNARAGGGSEFVIEADEYDRTFLGLHPDVAVVTNVELDHPDCYPTYEDFERAFAQFADQVGSMLIVCRDDPGAMALKPAHAGRRTYGLDPASDLRAEDVRPNPAGGSDFLVFREQETLGLVRTRLPGEHNVRNALASLAVSEHLGIDFRVAREALTEFHGAGRRFEIKGQAGGVTVIDDYAHHPTEIRATLAAAKQRFPEGEIWAVFQPHTYSRLRALEAEFARAFEDADHLFVTEVFAAREPVDPDFGGEQIAELISHPEVEFVPDFVRLASELARAVRPGDVVITLSAGDGNLVGDRLLEILSRNEGEGDHG